MPAVSVPVDPTAAPLLFREIAVTVRGKVVHTVCPIWCVADHERDQHSDLSDVTHFSPALPLGLPADGQSTPGVELYWSPAGPEGHNEPVLLAWGDGDATQYDLPAAERLLGRLSGLVEQLRALKATA